MIQPVRIGKHLVGPDQPCLIIAEAGVNHNGSLEIAKDLVRAAVDAGADIVKFQTFSPETVVTRNAPKAVYQQQTTSIHESQLEMLQKLALSHEDFDVIKNYADELKIAFLSTPNDFRDVEFLNSLDVSAFKLASMDIVNYPLLDYVGRKGLPVIVSTGMATLGEIERGIEILMKADCNQIVLLHCVTGYPVSNDDVNLRVMDTLSQAFHLPVGYSDHTTGIPVPTAAVAMGACVIEKHFTLDKTLPGPDHATSLEPEDFSQMVTSIRSAQAALGSSVKHRTQVESINQKTMRRSIVATTEIPRGTILESRHLSMKRPGNGLCAEFIPMFIGQRTTRGIKRDQAITIDALTR